MKRYIALAIALVIVLAIAVTLLLTGSVLPCLADAGSGVGIEATATVVPGESGGGHSWSGGSGYHHIVSPAKPVVETEDTTPIPPVKFVPPAIRPPYEPPEYVPYVPAPVDTRKIMLIVGLLFLAGMVYWWHSRQENT